MNQVALQRGAGRWRISQGAVLRCSEKRPLLPYFLKIPCSNNYKNRSILPRDAMLVRYICRRVSVRPPLRSSTSHKPALYQSIWGLFILR